MMKKRSKRALCGVIAAAAGATAALCHVLNKREKEEFNNEPEPENGEGRVRRTFYEKYIKRTLDITISCLGLIFIAPVIAVSSAVVFLEDPGHVIFRQKRVGRHKSYFYIHKLRSMKQNCPDIPTHLMENPEQYILKSGKIFRKFSIDELPQLIDIIRGKMSLVGPRPALWNQDDLVAERDQYGANDVMPGLTGWAQINGRDELEIPVKAKLDGEYVKALKKSSLSGFIMDCRCLLGTVTSVLHHEGVVEGGTGELHKEEQLRKADSGISGSEPTDPDSVIGFRKPVTVNASATKKVLITGAGSYIGESFETYAKEHYGDNFAIDTLDMQDPGWRQKDFSGYDIVYHVAGLAHADVGKVSEETKQKYYAVNTDLAIETAEKAKVAGVKLFVFMSSMIVYGDSAPYGKQKMITFETKPEPVNFYGDSKWQADKGVRALTDADFKVAVLRPPMIYGRGSKGNYPTLSKLARKLPVFPDVENQRSMLYIENLCEFLCQIMLVDSTCYSGKGNLFFPQNEAYTKTSEMVRMIGETAGHKMKISKVLAPAVFLMGKVPGKIGALVNKAFGNNCYSKEISSYSGVEYQKFSLQKSIIKTETETKMRKNKLDCRKKKTIWIIDHYSSEPQYGGISRQYDFAVELGKRGYNVVVIASGFSHFTHSYISEKSMLVNEISPRVHYIYLKTSAYIENGGVGRAKNMIDFMFKVMKYEKQIAQQFGKPDVVNGCSVHPLAWVAAYKIARKYEVRFCVEVRDFWPRIWVVSGEKKPTDPMVLFFGMIQKWAFKKADRIIYSMYHGDKYICGELGYDKGKTFLIGQPMDCERYDYNKQNLQALPPEIIKFIEDGFICSFAGYYMTYEGIYVMLEAAKILKEKGLPIKMVFIGSGQEKKGMEQYVAYNHLDNVLVHDRIAKEAVPAILSHSDICMAHLEVKGHKEVYKYGVSKNKVNEYLYSGACTLYGFLYKDDAVATSGGGMVFEPYNAEDLASKIEEIYRMPESQRKQYGANGRKYIKENHSVDVLTDELLKVFFE